MSELANKRKPCIHLGVTLFSFKADKSSSVYSRTQDFVPTIVADDQMYYGYCINCLYPAKGDYYDQGHGRSVRLT
jgi:hypothetical protein